MTTRDNRGRLPHGITREVLEADELRLALQAQDPEIETVSNDAMRVSIASILASAPDGNRRSVWLFAYGSLLWNPCVAVAKRRRSVLYGYHRDFRIRLEHGRGSPEAPALMLGLVPGGSCRGMALKLEPDDLAHELLLVWRREMLTGVYQPRWVRARTDEGWLSAITFVVNPEHADYCGKLADDSVLALLATGVGTLGTARGYLDSTVDQLDAEGIHDHRLHTLQRRVRSTLASGL